MTGLLDVLKETALDTQFLDCFESSASREALAHDVRNRRLLLALYALGTNAGFKRVAAGVADVSIDELAHVHRRYIDAGALRAACARVTNATLAIVISDIIFGKPISNRGAGTCPGPSSACPTRTRHGSTAGRERSAYP